MKKEKGFTLVELMAAIVILGVLMATAAGAFGAIKKNNAKKELEQVAESIKKVGETMYTSSIINSKPIVDGNTKKSKTYTGRDLAKDGLLESETIENPYDKKSTCSVELKFTKLTLTDSTNISACVTCKDKKNTIKVCK